MKAFLCCQTGTVSLINLKEARIVALSYNKLWKLLIDKNLSKTYLRENGIHPATIAKMGKDQPVSLQVLERLCKLLNCNIEDLVEYVPDQED